MNWNAGSTSCDKAREAIADAVLARRDATTDPEVQRHIAACAACRGYRADCESMWTKLGEVPVPAPSPNARARFDAAVTGAPAVIPSPTSLGLLTGNSARDLDPGAGGPSRRQPAWRRYAALAASLLVAVLLGYGAGARNASVPVAAETTPQFLLLLYDTRESNAKVTPATVSGVVAEYSEWARSLAAAGQLVSAEKLSDAPSDWLGGPVGTSDGERVGGFFLIRARDLNEARQIAGRCPHLKYGGRVELRPIEST